MSAVEVTMYRIRCDEPGCDEATAGHAEYGAFDDLGAVREGAEELEDWDTTEAAQDRDYCPEHAKPVCEYCDERGTVHFPDDDISLCASCNKDQQDDAEAPR